MFGEPETQRLDKPDRQSVYYTNRCEIQQCEIGADGSNCGVLRNTRAKTSISWHARRPALAAYPTTHFDSYYTIYANVRPLRLLYISSAIQLPSVRIVPALTWGSQENATCSNRIRSKEHLYQVWLATDDSSTVWGLVAHTILLLIPHNCIKSSVLPVLGLQNDFKTNLELALKAQ
jgi:hypothetical protein